MVSIALLTAAIKNFAAELLESVRQMNAGKTRSVSKAARISPVVMADFDAADCLKTGKDVTEYLTAMIEYGNPAMRAAVA